MNKKYLVTAILSGVIVALDQITKILVLSKFKLGESYVVVENFFNLTFVKNFGAAFGFLAQSHPQFREIFFLVMPPLAMIVIGVLLKSADSEDKVQVLALSSILGGAIGNYIDRLRFRYVVDFLDFHWFNQYSWPAFNIADSAIVVGVMVLMIQMFFESRKAKSSQNK
ncbi:MAG: signal peptidase II [Bdellovibrionales bacterium]